MVTQLVSGQVLGWGGKQNTATSRFQRLEIPEFCLRGEQGQWLGTHPQSPSQHYPLSLLASVSYAAVLHTVLCQPHWFRWPVSHSQRSTVALLCPKPASRSPPRDTASSPDDDCVDGTGQRIPESHINLGWKGSLKVTWSIPHAKQGQSSSSPCQKSWPFGHHSEK